MTMTVQRLRDFLRGIDGEKLVVMKTGDGETSDFSVQNASVEVENETDDGVEVSTEEVVLLTAHLVVDSDEESE